MNTNDGNTIHQNKTYTTSEEVIILQNTEKIDHLQDHNYVQNIVSDKPNIEIEPNNDNELWQQVQYKQKKRSQDNSSAISLKKSKYDSDAVALHNSFEALNTDNDKMDADDVNSSPAAKEPKPPPIHIPGLKSVTKMVEVIESVVNKDDYSYKCMTQNNVKIFPKTSDCYRKLVRKFLDLKISFHTYQLKQERAYRVVLKHMHFSSDPNEIKDALEQHGHTVRNVTNAISKKDKNPLSLFYIDLEPRANNKDIYNLNYLLNAKIQFEPPYKKREVVQCKRCQQYGHTKAYCRHPFMCVKCGLNHDSLKCNKSNDTPATCALCGGDHPANYKGCTVYRDLQKKDFPALRPKIAQDRDKNEANHDRPNTEEATSSNSSKNNVKPGISYSQTVRKNTCHSDNMEDNSSVSLMMKQFFDKFEKLFMEQSQQIGTLLNLLTAVIKKLT